MTKAQSSNVLTQPIPRLAGTANLCMQEKKICFKKLERRGKNCKAMLLQKVDCQVNLDQSHGEPVMPPPPNPNKTERITISSIN